MFFEQAATPPCSPEGSLLQGLLRPAGAAGAAYYAGILEHEFLHRLEAAACTTNRANKLGSIQLHGA